MNKKQPVESSTIHLSIKAAAISNTLMTKTSDKTGFNALDLANASEVDKDDRVTNSDPKNMQTNKGISSDVLKKLLPGEDIVVISDPVIKGGLLYQFIKRCFDVTASIFALLVLAIPILIIATKLKNDSDGPIIYKQSRVGKNGRIFDLYKFRSMYKDAEERGAQWALGNDPRVTPFGKVMRKNRLDEIPQFWNVIKGDMSLIGPRPERPQFCEEFEKRIHGWHYRTKVAPGLSGLAQVTGGYALLPSEKVLLDIKYIESRCFLLDLQLICKTLSVIKSGEGAR